MDYLWLVLALFQIVIIGLWIAHDDTVLVAFAVYDLEGDARRRVITYGNILAVTLRAAIVVAATGSLVPADWVSGKDLAAYGFAGTFGVTLIIGILRLYRSWKAYRLLTLDSPNDRKPNTLSWDIVSVTSIEFAAAAEVLYFNAAISRGNVSLFALGILLSLALRTLLIDWVSTLFKQHPRLGWLGLLVTLYVALDLVYSGGHEVTCVTLSFGCSESLFQSISQSLGIYSAP